MNTTTSKPFCSDALDAVNICSWQFIVKTAVLSLMAIITLIGNLMVIIAASTFSKQKKTVSNLFICSLAVTDLGVSAVVLPFSITYQILGHWVFGQLLCELWLVMDMIVCLSSISHLCAISIDRYLAVCQPLRYHQIMTKSRSRIICLCSWVLATTFALPTVYWPKSSVPQQNDNFLNATNSMFTTPNPLVPSDSMNLPLCLIGKNPLGYRIAAVIIFFWPPSILMASIYIKIYKTARKHIKQMRQAKCARQPTEPSSGVVTNDKNNVTATEFMSIEDEGKVFTVSVPEISDTSIPGEGSTVYTRASTSNPTTTKELARPKSLMKESTKQERRVLRTVAVIVGTFLVCWSPWFIHALVIGIGGFTPNLFVLDFVFWLRYAKSLLNPFIYAVMAHDFRVTFRKMISCQSCKSQ